MLFNTVCRFCVQNQVFSFCISFLEIPPRSYTYGYNGHAKRHFVVPYTIVHNRIVTTRERPQAISFFQSHLSLRDATLSGRVSSNVHRSTKKENETFGTYSQMILLTLRPKVLHSLSTLFSFPMQANVFLIIQSTKMNLSVASKALHI